MMGFTYSENESGLVTVRPRITGTFVSIVLSVVLIAKRAWRDASDSHVSKFGPRYRSRGFSSSGT